MAPSTRAEVVLSPLMNCLVNLPGPLVSALSNANALAQNVVVEIQFRSPKLSSGAVSSGNTTGFQKSGYAGWSGLASKPRTALVMGTERSRGKEQDVQGFEIDVTFAKLLGLSEGQRVDLLLHIDPPVAHTVNIEPLTSADWEAIELHATFLEINLLSQIRALPNPSFSGKGSTQVERAHPLPLHLSPTSTANIVITSLSPPIPNTVAFAKIAPDAEVIVAPKERPRSGRGDSRSIASRRSGKSGTSARTNGGRKAATEKQTLFLRAIAQEIAKAWSSDQAQFEEDHGLRLWVGKELMSSSALRGTEWVSISLVKPAGLRAQLDQAQVQKLKEEGSSDAGLPGSKCVAQILPWSTPVNDQHVVVSSQLCQILGVEGMVGPIVRLEPAPPRTARQAAKSGLKFFPFVKDSSGRQEGLKFGGESQLSRQAQLENLRQVYGGEHALLSGPVTDGMVLPPISGSNPATAFEGGLIRLDVPASREQGAPNMPPWLLGREHKLDIQVRAEIPHPVPFSTLFPSFSHGLPKNKPELISIERVIEKCMSNLTLCSSVLLTGGVGSGKTHLARLLCMKLRNEYLFTATYVSCRKLVADEIRVSSIKDTLTKVFMTAAWCARLGGQAVVVLDDLDTICPVETELQVGNDNGRSRQITELICGIIRQYCSVPSGVAVLATAQSKDALNNIIIGGHVVGEIIALYAPDKEARRRILDKLVYEGNVLKTQTNGVNGHARHSSDPHDSIEDSWMDPSNPMSRPSSSSSSPPDGFHVSSTLDLLDVAGKTDGYMPADLVLLVSRARNEAMIRAVAASDNTDTTDPTLTLTKADFNAALRNFTPSSLRNVTLTHSTTTFSSIGGLKATRDTLLETLLYPTKYAPVFASSPLRLRSGLLLYGYPGCGKTLLASAVAGECNLNFISVKGPEILNKYIGASEKSVRDLFERAQAAKPCVLFFDEFDSIAPKRGHDSTGVTDRVVNQMLTQMDGAEGLEGVYVLAATSRPDLIDPALLRPGRLDKSLLCDMPTVSDREDILHAVSDKLTLRDAVKDRMHDLATRTEGFSGADLQALMYNAHLEAIHDLLGDDNSYINNTDTRKPLPNGTKPPPPHKPHHHKGSKPHHKHDFIHFLYGPGEEENITSAGHKETRASIAEKLEALKLERKRIKQQLVRPTPTNSNSNSNTTAKQGEETKEEVVIEWKHIERALASTRSSISADERRRLAAIYREFVVGRNGEMPSGDGGREVGGRSSLM